MTPPTGPLTRGAFLHLFTAVMLPMIMAAIDQTLLSTAAPVIHEELGGLRDMAWLALSYLLVSTVAIPIYGRLGDRYGRRRVLLIALAIFTVGSLFCAAAPSLPMLIAARALQGLGGGGLMTLCQALIGELVVPRERARFQGYFATLFAVANVGGPVIGGIVVHHTSWRWLFLANLPLALLAWWRLSKLPAKGGQPDAPALEDRYGALLFAGAVATFLWWTTAVGNRLPWLSGYNALAVAVIVVLGFALWRRERSFPKPMLPVALLGRAVVSRSVAAVALNAGAMLALVFFFPTFLRLTYGTDPAQSGLLMLPLTVGMLIGSVTNGRVVSKTGHLTLLPVPALMVTTLALLAMAAVRLDLPVAVALMALAGIGMGTVMSSAQILVQTEAGPGQVGVATAAVSLFRALGSAGGTAVFGAVVFGAAALLGTDAATEPSPTAVTTGFRIGFLVTALMTAGASFAMWRIPSARLAPGAP
ncbi:MAG: MFS transporter [Burkholderiales bacterium]|nr:MFS transporter [Burkholderiales bacterium]